MNEAIQSRRGTWRRILCRTALVTAVMLGAVLLAACHAGGNPNHTPVDGGGKTPYQRALAIAQCMRQNGVPSFPDPGSNGAFPASADKNKSSASFQSAVKACQSLPSNGVGNSPF